MPTLGFGATLDAIRLLISSMVFWELVIVFLLLLLNGFFAMSELAVVSSRQSRLKQMAEEGRPGAQAAAELLADPSRFLSTVQIGITLIGILAGAYGGATIAGHFGAYLATFPLIAPYSDALAMAIVVICITYLSLIVGELVPKRVALNHAETIASSVALPMGVLARAAAPMVWLLGVSTEAVLRLLRLHRPRELAITEEEVKSLIAEGTRTGVFEPTEKEMIDSVLRLSDRSVRAIMVPRGDVVWLDVDDPIDVIRAEITASGCSRFPVAQGQIDNLLGIVQTKDLLDRMLQGKPLDLRACLRNPVVVHETAPVFHALELFKQSPVHMAVVVDEYGGVEGIITLSDILEGIAGELPEPGQEVKETAVRRDDGSWLLDGMTPIDEVESLLGLRNMREGGDFDTLAGFVLSRFGHLPQPTESFRWEGVSFEVVDMDGRRIDKLLVTPPQPPHVPAENRAE